MQNFFGRAYKVYGYTDADSLLANLIRHQYTSGNGVIRYVGHVLEIVMVRGSRGRDI